MDLTWSDYAELSTAPSSDTFSLGAGFDSDFDAALQKARALGVAAHRSILARLALRDDKRAKVRIDVTIEG